MKTFNRSTGLIFGAIALILGAIGPWISVLGFIGGGPANSLEVGSIVFGGIALVIISALLGRFMRTVSIIVGVLVLAEVVNVFININSANSDSDLGSLASPGWGLYLSAVAGLYLIVSTFVFAKQTPMQQYGISKVTVVDMDETYVDGQFNPYGRCDTCGAPCDKNGCSADQFHLVALG